jgi:hypothetical protein
MDLTVIISEKILIFLSLSMDIPVILSILGMEGRKKNIVGLISGVVIHLATR